MAKKNKKENKVKNANAKSMAAELKKVSWPSAETLSKSTAAVLFLVITVAVIIFVSDALFGFGSKKFSEYIVNKNGTSTAGNTENVTSTTTEENKETNSENKTSEETKVEENKTAETNEAKEQ